jgi:TP901 family phage tail tape measure protein
MSDTNVGTVSIDLQLDDWAFDRALLSAETKAQATGRSIDKELSGATNRTESRFASFGSIATKALGATGIAAGIAGIAAVKMAGNFEQSLNVFQSVSGATAKQMELVAAKARELGQDASLPGISARDAAAALTELAKAGLSVNESLAASKGVLSLAKAGNLDVADAASIAAKALNSFGLAGSQAARVADLLAAAANASTAGVDDIALGLAQVGAGAKQMGVSLQDTVTSLALFANAGIRGQDAGTSRKQMFIQLASPTKQASELMKKLGLDFFDAKGNFIGLEKTSAQLQTKLAKLTQEQRNNALATIFGSDSMRVAAILADQGAKGFDSMAKAVNKQGAATELAAAQNKGFNGALDNFISTLQTVGTDLGTKVLPPLTDFLRVLAKQLPPAVDFAVKHGQDLAVTALAIGSAFAAIRIAAFVRDLVLAEKSLALFVGAKNASGIRAFGAAFAFMGRSAVASFAAIRVGLFTVRGALITTGVGALIVGLGLAADLIITHWDAVTKFFQSLGPKLQPFLTPLSEAFDRLRETVGRIADEAGKKLLPALEQVGKSLQGPVGAALQAVLTLALKLAKLFGSTLVENIAVGLTALAGFINFVNDVILKLEAFAKGTSDNFDKVKNALANFGRDVADKITGSLGAAVDFVVKSFDRIIEALKPWQRDFKGTLIKTLDEASKALIDYDIKTLNSWADWIEGTLDATAKWAGAMADRIGSSATAFAKQIGDALSAVPEAVGHWLDETLKRVELWGTNLLTSGGKAVSDFIGSVLQFFSDLPTNIAVRLETIVTTVTNFFAGLPDRISAFLSDSGKRASGSFVDGLDGFLKNDNTIRKIGDTILLAFALVLVSIGIYLIDTGARIVGKIAEGIVRNVTALIITGQKLIDGLVKGIENGAPAVVNKIKEICAQSLDAIKKFFGIHSPSIVMADMGENLMKGLVDRN